MPPISRGEDAELEPAREHLALFERVVAAHVRAPEGQAEEAGPQHADDGDEGAARAGEPQRFASRGAASSHSAHSA